MKKNEKTACKSIKSELCSLKFRDIQKMCLLSQFTYYLSIGESHVTFDTNKPRTFLVYLV